jgi:hypothetical protein
MITEGRDMAPPWPHLLVQEGGLGTTDPGTERTVHPPGSGLITITHWPAGPDRDEACVAGTSRLKLSFPGAAPVGRTRTQEDCPGFAAPFFPGAAGGKMATEPEDPAQNTQPAPD